MKKSVLIIGAGPSGMACLNAFKHTDHDAELTCFEQTSRPGGQWAYTNHSGIDAQGNAVVTSMYNHLWVNAPKECIEFADYPYTEFTPNPVPSYPPRQFILDYMIARANKLKLLENVHYNTSVKWISYSDETKKFTVMSEDTNTATTQTSYFTHVIVCTSHFTFPYIPNIEGEEKFHGRLLHSHDFRDARQFTGENVVVVGAHYSAEDIAQQCDKFGAASITISYRSKPMGTAIPETWTQKPLIQRINADSVTFVDGTSIKADSIILCTGYRHHYPFLDNDLRPKLENRLWLPNLFKSIVHKTVPQLTFIGATDLLYTFALFSAQSYYVRDLILDRLQAPSDPEMMDLLDLDFATRGAKLTGCGGTRCGFNCSEKFQRDYIAHLISLTDHPQIPFEKCTALLCGWQDMKFESVEKFRDVSYPSAYTGVVAPERRVKWIEEMDDSVEKFIKN